MASDKHGQLLYIGKGKGQGALKGFFDMLTEQQKSAIKVVGADRSNAYTKAVEEHLPHADICYDHFHIVQNLNDAVTRVRRAEFKRNDPGSKEPKEDLRHMYTLKDEQEAAKHLANWAKMAGESGLKPFVTPAKTLSAQARAVLGYFRHGLTSGVIEGLNSKIAKIQFQVRGISSIRLLYLKLRESTCKEFRERLMPICAQS